MTTSQRLAENSTDPAVLFDRYHGALRRRVRQLVTTSEANVEDACMFAWVQLLRHRVDIGGAYGWLITVAVREAIKLDRRSRRTVALASRQDGELLEPADPRDQIQARELVNDTATIIQAAGLTRRQARMLGLQPQGFSYQEI